MDNTEFDSHLRSDNNTSVKLSDFNIAGKAYQSVQNNSLATIGFKRKNIKLSVNQQL